LCVIIFLVKRTVDGRFVTRYTNVKLNELIGCVTVCNLQCCVTNLSNHVMLLKFALLNLVIFLATFMKKIIILCWLRMTVCHVRINASDF